MAWEKEWWQAKYFIINKKKQLVDKATSLEAGVEEQGVAGAGPEPGMKAIY